VLLCDTKLDMGFSTLTSGVVFELASEFPVWFKQSSSDKIPFIFMYLQRRSSIVWATESFLRFTLKNPVF
jgi:hypothetical protein